MRSALSESRACRCCPGIHRDRAMVDPAVRERVRRIIEQGGPWPLTVLGPVGCGKTCLALCVADYWQARRAPDAFYFTTSELGAMLADARCGRLCYPRGALRSERSLFDDLEHYGLVIVDELGLRTTPPESEYDAVKRTLDARQGRPMVVLANLSLVQLGAIYDERIISRLAAGTILEMRGPDRRLPAHRPARPAGDAVSAADGGRMATEPAITGR